jgi:hypothetical protein
MSAGIAARIGGTSLGFVVFSGRCYDAGEGRDPMRVVVPLIALLLAASASAQQARPVPLSSPSVVTALPQKNCRDRLFTVRDERGLQRLDRDARPADPLMILAVHKTIDGCAVLVTVTGDRPLPEPREHRLMPSR